MSVLVGIMRHTLPLYHAWSRKSKTKPRRLPDAWSLLLFLPIARLTRAAGKHGERGKPDQHVHDAFHRWDASEDSVDQVEIKRADKPPIKRADPHEDHAHLVEPAQIFRHHSDAKLRMNCG